jgi:folate-dependent phosphoribosylglycinamide formyltransferase PurN
MATTVGFLTTRHHPLLPYLLEEVASVGGIEPMLLFDAKDFGRRDAALFEERTGGAFPARPVSPAHWAAEVTDHNSLNCIDLIRTCSLGLAVNAGTPRLIGVDLLAAPTQGVLNVHPGILPKYRGASCPEWAVYHGDPVGVTAHFMDTGLDSGPIVASRTLPVVPGMTYRELRVALYRLQLKFMAQSIRRVLEAGLTAAALPPQPHAEVFRPMPDELLTQVRLRLARGEYRPAGEGEAA